MSRGRSGKRGFGDDGWGGMGGYMKAKVMKLNNQFEEDAPRSKEQAGTSSSIFKGVSIYVNGYTDPPAAELKKLMMTHGGRYIYYPNKTNTTHIIANNLAYTKIKELKNEKVVMPSWITDSIKAGKLLPHAPYLVYRPKASNQSIHRFTASKLPSDKSDIIADEEMASTVSGAGSSLATGEQENSMDVVVNDSENVEVPTSVIQSDNAFQNVTPSCSEREIKDLSSNRQSEKSLDVSGSNSLSEVNKSGECLSTGNSSGNDHESFKSPPNPSGGAFPKSGDPSFLSEFYSNSRLHHISTWGAEYKAFVNELQRTGDRSFPGRAKLKGLVDSKNDLQQVQSGDEEEFQGPSTSMMSSAAKGQGKEGDRVIMHIDMDCFFVSVSLLNHPELRGKPVAVTHSKGKGGPGVNKEAREFEIAYYQNKLGPGAGMPAQDGPGDDSESKNQTTGANEGPLQETAGTGKQTVTDTMSGFSSMAEIASCSYEARQAGVKNGMFMGRAKELCPELKTIPYDFEGYQRVSRCLYETVASYTHDIEAVSCDEMLVDITSIMTDTGAKPLEVARILREEVYSKTKCHASTGLASNILLARLSTRKAKPNGMFHLEAGSVEDFMKDISVRDLPGVGWSTNKMLLGLGISSCRDLQNVPLSTLQKEFGPKTGQQLYSYCRGQDDRPIRMERERKSVSAEVNYGIRFKGEDEAMKFITDLAAEVHKRLHNLYMVGRTITLKLKVRQAGAPKETSKFMGHGVCDDKARSITLGQETDDLSVIQRESKSLFLQIRARPEDVRGVGIQVSRLKSKNTLPSASKSLVDMLPKKADMPTANKPHNTTTGIHRPQEAKPKQKTSSLLYFVQKGGSKEDRNSPKKASGERRVSLTKEPTLPRLPTLDSPPSSEKSAFRGVITPRVPPPHGTGFSLPSPSQLDLSVLNSLPKELQKQILQEYNQSGAFKEQPQQSLLREDLANKRNPNKPADSPPRDRIQRNTYTTGLNESQQTNKQLAQGLNTEYPQQEPPAPPVLPRAQEFSSRPNSAPNNKKRITGYSTEKNTSLTCFPISSFRTTTRVDPNQASTSTGVTSSLDQDVLQHLPPEILQEVLENERKQAAPSQNVLPNLGTVEELPSFSQIDPSCLEALPEDMRNEIKSAYQRRHPAPKTRPSPNKQASPFKIAKRKGRPKKTSPSKLPWQQNILEAMNLQESPSKSRGAEKKTGVSRRIGVEGASGVDSGGGDRLGPPGSGEDVRDSEKRSDNMGEDVQENKQQGEQSTGSNKDVANLAGAVKLKDVKDLLREWTGSFKNPLEDDIGIVVQYLRELILERNLEMVHLVLRGLRRIVRQSDSHQWVDACTMITHQVQNTVEQFYGSTLKL